MQPFRKILTGYGPRTGAEKKITFFAKDPPPAITSMNITLMTDDPTSWMASANAYKFELDDTYEGLRKEIRVPDDVLRYGNISVNASGE